MEVAEPLVLPFWFFLSPGLCFFLGCYAHRFISSASGGDGGIRSWPRRVMPKPGSSPELPGVSKVTDLLPLNLNKGCVPAFGTGPQVCLQQPEMMAV